MLVNSMLEIKLDKITRYDRKSKYELSKELELLRLNPVAFYPDSLLLVLRSDEGELLSYLGYTPHLHDSFLNDRWKNRKRKVADKDFKKVSGAKMWNYPGYDAYRKGQVLVSLDWIMSLEQGQGYGHRIVDALKSESDMIELLSNDSNRDFYKKMDFVDTGLYTEPNFKFMVWVKNEE